MEGYWTLTFTCLGRPEGEDDRVQYSLPRSHVNFGHLLTLKSQLGYGTRDYFYYKKRAGHDVATLKEIAYDGDANDMITNYEDEREVRLVLSKDQVRNNNVAITPLKRPCTSFDEDEDLALLALDAYKDWLKILHMQNQGMGE